MTILYAAPGGVLKPYCPAYEGISLEEGRVVLPSLRSRFPRERLLLAAEKPVPPAKTMKWHKICHIGGAR